MNKDWIILFGFALILVLMQMVGGVIQVKGYQKSIHRMRQKGDVGLGQKGGKFLVGNIAVVAARNRIVTGIETLDGLTIIAKFHPVKKLIGIDVEGVPVADFLEMFRSLPLSKQKKYRAYIRALESLELRYYKEDHPEEFMDEDLDPTESLQIEEDSVE